MHELEIDWNGLHSAFQMNMPEVKCFLNTDDGSVLKISPGDPRINEVRGHTQRFAPVEAVPSRIQYQWLDSFIHTIEDETLRVRMEAAVNGKGAFRRFKDILLTVPDERRRWFEFRDTMIRERIVEWVAEQGVQASNEPVWEVRGEPGDGEPTPQSKDTEELRDYVIAWLGENDAETAPLTPILSEKLATDICTQFKVSRRVH